MLLGSLLLYIGDGIDDISSLTSYAVNVDHRRESRDDTSTLNGQASSFQLNEQRVHNALRKATVDGSKKLMMQFTGSNEINFKIIPQALCLLARQCEPYK